MKSPSNYDEGWFEELGPQDKRDFEKLYTKKGRSIDEERAKESYKLSFESDEEAKFRLFRDIVNAFSSGKAGFEATIVNPIYEYGESEIELLLAKPQANSVHLCFVSCDIGGQDYIDWSERFNKAHKIVENTDAIKSIKKHIHCSDIPVGSIQYVTVTQDIDIPDANMHVLKSSVNPEYYAVWKLIRSAEYNEKTEEMEDAKTIKYHDGRMSVPDFESVCRSGIDPKAADNDDIKYSLTSHPVFPLSEVCLDLYLRRYPTDENPKEFFESEFKSVYLDNMHFGDDRGGMTQIAQDNATELVDFALQHDILESDPDTVKERDYKIMWESKDPGDIKSVVKEKFIKSKVPYETGKMAYSQAKEVFEEGEHSLDDFK